MHFWIAKLAHSVFPVKQTTASIVCSCVFSKICLAMIAARAFSLVGIFETQQFLWLNNFKKCSVRNGGPGKMRSLGASPRSFFICVQTSSKNRREHGKHSGKTAAASGISTGLSTHNHRRTELCFSGVLADDSASRRTRVRPLGDST